MKIDWTDYGDGGLTAGSFFGYTMEVWKNAEGPRASWEVSYPDGGKSGGPARSVRDGKRKALKEIQKDLAKQQEELEVAIGAE